MSRIGKQSIEIPQGVEVSINLDNTVAVKGPKGELKRSLHPDMIISMNDNLLTVKRPNDQRRNRALHGLTRSLLFNMVEGVFQGFQKELEIVGVGYRAEKKGRNLLLSLGYSHQVMFVPPEGIELNIKGPLQIIVSGIDKELVGTCAAKIRSFRKPEPYKGKGIRYKGEYVQRKAGKTAK